MRASLREFGITPDVMDMFAVLSIYSAISCMMSLRSSVGTGSTSHDLDGDLNTNLITSFSVTGANSSKLQSKSMLDFSVGGVYPKGSAALLMSHSLVLIFSIFVGEEFVKLIC